MTPFKASVLASVVSALLTAGVLNHFQGSRAREAARLRDANNHLRYSAHQRRPAASAAVPPREAGVAGVVGATAASPGGGVRSGPPPAGAYRDEGRASPVAALQTLAWCGDRGDAAAMERLLCFDPAARAKADAFFAALPAGARGSWRNADEMAAALLTSEAVNHPFPHVTVLATARVESLGEDRVRLRLPGTPQDGLEFRRCDGGWRRVITEAMVDAYVGANASPGR